MNRACKAPQFKSDIHGADRQTDRIDCRPQCMTVNKQNGRLVESFYLLLLTLDNAMQPPCLRSLSQAVIVRTLVCKPDDCIERKLLIELFRSSQGSCFSEDVLVDITERFPQQLTDELLYVLAPKHIKHLKMKGCSRVTCEGLAKTIARCSSLNQIDFNACVHLLHPTVFCCLKDFAPNITSLIFEDCDIMMDDSVQIILMCCPQLEHLNLSCCSNITDDAFNVKTSTEKHKVPPRVQQAGKNLSSVDISGCPSLTNDAIKNLVALCGSTLVSVNIAWTGVGCIALLYLSGFSQQDVREFVHHVDPSCSGLLGKATYQSEDETTYPANGMNEYEESNLISEMESNPNITRHFGVVPNFMNQNVHGFVQHIDPSYSGLLGEATYQSEDETSYSVSDMDEYEDSNLISEMELNPNTTRRFGAGSNSIDENPSSHCVTLEQNLEDASVHNDKSQPITSSASNDTKTNLSSSSKSLNQEMDVVHIRSTSQSNISNPDSEQASLSQDLTYALVSMQDCKLKKTSKDTLQQYDFFDYQNCNLAEVDLESSIEQCLTNALVNTQGYKPNTAQDNLQQDDFSDKENVNLTDIDIDSSIDQQVKATVNAVTDVDDELAWQQINQSCNNDFIWSDESTAVDSVSQAFGEGLSCLSNAFSMLDISDDDDECKLSDDHEGSDDIGDVHVTSVDHIDDDGSVDGSVDDSADDHVGGGDVGDDHVGVGDVGDDHVTSVGHNDDDISVDGSADDHVGVGDDHDTSVGHNDDGDIVDGNANDNDNNASDNDSNKNCDDIDHKHLKGQHSYINADQIENDQSTSKSCSHDLQASKDNEVHTDVPKETTWELPKTHNIGNILKEQTPISVKSLDEACIDNNGSASQIDLSLDQTDEQLVEMFNFDEVTSDDLPSALHGFSDALACLTTAMEDLINAGDSDDENDVDDHDGNDDSVIDDNDGDNDNVDGGNDVGDNDGDDNHNGNKSDRNSYGENNDKDEPQLTSPQQTTSDEELAIDSFHLHGDGSHGDKCHQVGSHGDGCHSNHNQIVNQTSESDYQSELDGLGSASMEQISLVILPQEEDSPLVISDVVKHTNAEQSSSGLQDVDVIETHNVNAAETGETSNFNTELCSNSQCSLDEKTQLPADESVGNEETQHEGSTESEYYIRDTLHFSLTYKPQLRAIDISDIYFHSKPLGVACLKVFMDTNKSLNSFAASWSELDDDTLISLVKNKPDLCSLTLVDCENISDKSLQVLPAYCPKLKKIDLRGVPFITDCGVVPMLSCPSLLTLSLAEASVTDMSMFAITEKCGDKLCDLDLSWCEDLTDKGMAAIATGCTGLRTLALRQCAATFVTIETLSCCSGLTSLNIAGIDQLTDQMVVTMAASLPSLQFVDISWNSSVTSVGVNALMLNCCKLQEANLSGLKCLTSKPFLPIISDLHMWRAKQEVLQRHKFRSQWGNGPAVNFIKPCPVEIALSLGDDLPFRSTTYCPLLRSLILEYSDQVNDDHMAQIVAVCRGTLSVSDYYSQPIDPKWIFFDWTNISLKGESSSKSS